MTFIAFPSVPSRAFDRCRPIEWVGIFLALLIVCLSAKPVSAQVGESYRIQPTDVLVVEVVSEPQLGAKEFRVSATGEISYPFIGPVRAADRTIGAVQEDIKRLLEADYLVNAQVLVQVRDYRKRLISVLGQVNKPGLIEIPPERNMSVIEAITAAGGFTRLARSSGIQLNRKGRTEAITFSVDDLKNPEKVFFVEPDDVIYVPESRI